MLRAVTMRYGTAGLAVSGLALAAALVGTTTSAHAQASFVDNGEAGFVVSHFEYALSHDAEETGACPDGMTQGFRGLAAAAGAAAGQGGQAGQAGQLFGQGQQPGQGQPGQGQGGQAGQLFGQGGQSGDAASQEEATRRFFERFASANGKNLCMNPEAGEPDPNFRTVSAPNIAVYGIDLDGQVSSVDGQAAAGTCAHDDFVGMNGEAGVDNQFFRVVGCSNSYQSTGQSNGYVTEMLTGAWGILITLSGVDDIKNDDSIEVGIYANADPIQLSPSREPLANATYAIDQDPRFRAKAKGRIVDGVVTTEPVDVRFHKVTNSIRLERPLKAARLQLTLSEDGTLEGVLAGYTGVEDMYDLQYGFRNGKNGAGEPADLALKLISSNGQAGVLGHTCNGAYYALHANADGHLNPETGKCTSISTQYRLAAIPAFIVDVETESVNEELAD